MRSARSAAALALTLVLAGCGGPAAPSPTPAAPAAASPAGQVERSPADLQIEVPRPSKPWKIGIAVPGLTDTYWVGHIYGTIDEAKKLGLGDVYYTEAQGFQAAKQVSGVEDLIARGIDGLLLEPVSPEVQAAIVDSAQAKGVKVVTIGSPAVSKVPVHIMSDDAYVGAQMALELGKQIGGSGNVAMVSGAEGVPFSKIRSDGFRESMAQNFPSVKIVAEMWNAFLDPASALKSTEDLLQRFPDLEGIYTTSDAVALGVTQALDAQGKSGKIAVATSSLSPTSIELLKAGKISVVTGEEPVLVARWGVRQLLRLLEGQEPTAKVMYVPHVVYTKDTVDSADLSIELFPTGWQLP